MKKKDEIVEPVMGSDGYLYVTLYKDGKGKTFPVHYLVVNAFPDICGKFYEGCTIVHLNGDKIDNRANNLRVV